MTHNDILVISVSQYVEHINQLVSLEAVLVEGEVSNFRDIPGRNFCYFDIKDDKTAAKCFQGFWHSKKIDLSNGTTVRVLGHPSLQRNGSLVIDVREVFLVGEGELMQAYLELKEQLQKEGLFDESPKKQLPVFPKTVGLIAGKNSSAYHDVAAELSERWGGAQVFFHPSKVQGVGAKNEVIGAIRHFNQNRPVDVLIVARGGGSMEDLQAFDSEEVVREIFASKIPIISAIGHEDHWTLSDFVSDVRAKTPTKAAQIAVPDKKEVLQRLEYFSDRSKQLVNGGIGELIHELNSYLNSTVNVLKSKIEIADSRLEEKKRQITGNVVQVIEAKTEKVRTAERALSLLNPMNVLSRGYAVVEKEGRKITSVVQIGQGDEVAGRLHDGKFTASISEVEKTR